MQMFPVFDHWSRSVLTSIFCSEACPQCGLHEAVHMRGRYRTSYGSLSGFQPSFSDIILSVKS